MTKQYDLILIDSNSIGYAAHSGRELKHHTGQIQAVFFGLKMIKKAVETFSTPHHTKVQALWDSPAKWRYDIHPEYKGKRDDDPVKAASRLEYKRQVPIIRKAFSLIGLEQVIVPGEEADDCGAAIVANNPDLNILLISGDHDWLQLVGIRCDWYDPREDGKFVNLASFEAFTGFKNVVQFAQAKAILGDSSDNIKGVPGLGEKATPLLFQHWGGVPGLLKYAATFPGQTEFTKEQIPEDMSRYRKPLSALAYGDSLAIFKRNMKLMNLLAPRYRGTEIIDKQAFVKSRFDTAAFTDFCHEYAFMSITSAMPSWQKTFG